MDNSRISNGFKILSLQMMFLICLIGSLFFAGYDCEPVITQLERLNNTTEQARLLQHNQFSHIETIQCKVIVTLAIRHCGWPSPPSHIFQTTNMLISLRECAQAHELGLITIHHTVIEGLEVNHTTTHQNILIIGTVDEPFNCIGGSYSDAYGDFENVVVWADFSITLRTQIATIDADMHEITLHSGHVCQFSEGTCMDIEGSNTFWDRTPQNRGASKYLNRSYDEVSGQANKTPSLAAIVNVEGESGYEEKLTKNPEKQQQSKNQKNSEKQSKYK